MSEHFIRNIEIKNFKLFKDFKAEGFGRVNLIGGKNNVGKTAFMEAVFLTTQLKEDVQHIFSALLNIEDNRNTIEEEIDNTALVKILKKFVPLELIDHLGHKLTIGITQDKLRLTILNDDKELDISQANNLGILTKHTASFLSSNSINNQTLKILFDGVKEQRKREELNKYLSDFDSDISDVDTIKELFNVYSISQSDWRSVFDYGDGIRHYIAYISALWANKNGFVYFDEIENGIHYTNFDKLWEIILTLSKEQNVQVFATTHSKECIESYARVAKKLKDDEIAFLDMGRKRDDSVGMVVMDHERFIEEINMGNEVRGW